MTLRDTGELELKSAPLHPILKTQFALRCARLKSKSRGETEQYKAPHSWGSNMKVEVTFPDETTYAVSLGRLRKKLKPNIRGLSIRRHPTGVIISGSPEQLVMVQLILPDNYRMRNLPN